VLEERKPKKKKRERKDQEKRKVGGGVKIHVLPSKHGDRRKNDVVKRKRTQWARPVKNFNVKKNQSANETSKTSYYLGVLCIPGCNNENAGGPRRMETMDHFRGGT